MIPNKQYFPWAYAFDIADLDVILKVNAACLSLDALTGRNVTETMGDSDELIYDALGELSEWRNLR
jgi:hypothetical protein